MQSTTTHSSVKQQKDVAGLQQLNNAIRRVQRLRQSSPQSEQHSTAHAGVCPSDSHSSNALCRAITAASGNSLSGQAYIQHTEVSSRHSGAAWQTWQWATAVLHSARPSSQVAVCCCNTTATHTSCSPHRRHCHRHAPAQHATSSLTTARLNVTQYLSSADIASDSCSQTSSSTHNMRGYAYMMDAASLPAVPCSKLHRGLCRSVAAHTPLQKGPMQPSPHKHTTALHASASASRLGPTTAVMHVLCMQGPLLINGRTSFGGGGGHKERNDSQAHRKPRVTRGPYEPEHSLNAAAGTPQNPTTRPSPPHHTTQTPYHIQASVLHAAYTLIKGTRHTHRDAPLV